MGSLVGLCVLTVLLGFVKTELQNKEFALGGNLTLKPAASPSSISSITWKHNDNLLAEQLSSDSKPDYYPPTEKRISLNFKTGELSITKLTEKDAGKYNVEINNVIQNVGYQVKIVKRVPVPTVVVQPLACSDTTPNCTVDCQGDVTGAGTVRYFWKEDEGDWKESAKKKEIKNEDTQKIKEFFCKVKNSVSDEESPATKNPFYKETSSSAGKLAGIIVTVILLLLIIISGLAVAYKKGLFKNWAPKTNNRNGTPPVEQPLVTKPESTSQPPVKSESTSQPPVKSESNSQPPVKSESNSQPPVKSESNSQPPGPNAGSALKPTTKSDPTPATSTETSSKV